MTKQFVDRFFEWQNYLHYILLTLIVASYFGIHNQILQDSLLGYGKLFLLIFIVDTIVHSIFWFLPKSLRWRD